MNKPITYFIIATVFSFVLSLSLTSHARDYPFVTNAMQYREKVNEDVIQVKGKLACQMPEINQGQSCQIRLKAQQEDGKDYILKDAEEARELYFQGKKNVAIKGELIDSRRLRIKAIEAKAN